LKFEKFKLEFINVFTEMTEKVVQNLKKMDQNKKKVYAFVNKQYNTEIETN